MKVLKQENIKPGDVFISVRINYSELREWHSEMLLVVSICESPLYKWNNELGILCSNIGEPLTNSRWFSFNYIESTIFTKQWKHIRC